MVILGNNHISIISINIALDMKLYLNSNVLNFEKEI